MTQISLFNRVAETSIAVYRQDIAPTLQRREQAVLDALERCAEPPTSYELTERMTALGTALDVNSVRPRLTRLFYTRRVQHGPKRRCAVTGKTALTWVSSMEGA